MSPLDFIAGFVAGCLVWQFFGGWIKGWLHAGVRVIGEKLKAYSDGRR